jgi:hypothetical protein
MARTTGFWLLGMAGFLLVCEIVLRLLPVSTATATGYYLDPLILTYPPRHQWRVATGWDLRNAQTLQANNVGFPAEHDFVQNARAVALVGDSFVEASMLPAADRPAVQLERAIGARPVFAMGGPGSALLDYAERIRFAHERFAVRDFVVLMEQGDVRQSLCGSGNIHGPCLDRASFAPRTETLADPGLAKRVLRHSALAQYLFGQLKASPDRLWRQVLVQSQPAAAPTEVAAGMAAAPPAAVAADKQALAQVDVVTQAFFARIKPYAVGRLVIVMDGDRRGGTAQSATPADLARARFITLARQAGAVVVDAEPLYRAHYATSALTLEVGPYDAHLNALGINILMQAAAQAMNAR